MTDAHGRIAIGELSRQTGCNIETIRYYERIGVLPMALRRGRYRSYDGADVQRLRFVRRARELGFPIDVIRTLLVLADGGGASCAQARELAESHLSEVRAKIADLVRMEFVLDQAVRGCAAGDDDGCPLLEALGRRE